MKVLLISTNRLRYMSPPLPLGIGYILSNLDERHEVRVLDLMFLDGFEKEIKKTIEDFDPEAIGISIRNIDNTSLIDTKFFLPIDREVIKVCKESRAKIVLGGPGFSIMPKECLSYLKGDMGIVGEGEIAFNALLRRIEARENLGDIPGLITKDGVSQREFIAPLDLLKPPNRKCFNLLHYYGKEWSATIQSKRGCPFRCIYCCNPLIEGKKIRMRSPEKVVDELERMEGKDKISFVDAIFNNPIEHAEAICGEIIERGLNLSWNCTLNPKFADEHLVGLMAEAGCASVGLSSDSGSAKILKKLRKNFSLEDIVKCRRYCGDNDIDTYCFLLLGGPGEDKKTVKESASFMEELGPKTLHLGVGIRIFPGCEIEEIARRERALPLDADLLYPTFYLSPQVKGWIVDYVNEKVDREGWDLAP